MNNGTNIEYKPVGVLAVMDEDRRVLVAKSSTTTMAFVIAKHDAARAAVAELIDKAMEAEAALKRHFDCTCDGTEIRAAIELSAALSRAQGGVK